MKIIGKTGHHSRLTLAKEMGVDDSELLQLQTGSFFLKTSGMFSPIMFQNTKALLVPMGKEGKEWHRNSLYLDDDAWIQRYRDQQKQFGAPLGHDQIFLPTIEQNHQPNFHQVIANLRDREG